MKKFIQTFLFLFCFGIISNAQVKVTLSVNVSNETVDATGVHVAGNWDPANEWNPPANPMTDMGNGIWSIDITVAENSTFEYKFLLGNDWGLGNEGLNDKAGCIVGNGNTNRILTVGTSDFEVSTVCYNSCGACVGPDEQAVTFKVDLSAEAVINDPVYLSGSFPEMWNEAYVLTDENNDNIFTGTFVFPKGDYEYKFRNGADGWESVPSECASNGNRALTLGDEELFLDAVCINKCGPCVAVNTLNVTLQLDMTNVKATTGISPDGVSVAGDFQSAAGFGGNWSPGNVILTDDNDDNIYEISFTLPEGEYAFKYLNGNAWGTEESVPQECVKPGSGDRLMVIAGDDGANVTIGPFCFSSCEGVCPELKDPVNVTFRVDMTNEFVSAEGLYVAGDFLEGAKWDRDSLKMTETLPGLWEASVMVRPGNKYAYLFVNNGMTSGDETFDFLTNGCGVDNGFGGSNRLLDLTNLETDTVVTAFIFNSCDESSIIIANKELEYANELRVYPSPVNDVVNIDFGSYANQGHKIELYTITGNLVATTSISKNKVQSIDMSSFQAGMYFARILNENAQSTTVKLIKQ